MDQLDFNYRFTMNADHTGFDVEEADNLEVILNAWNPATQQVEAGLYKVTLKAGGNTIYKFEHAMSQQPGMALVVLVPSEFEFAIADKLSGEWRDCFCDSIKNQVSVAEGKEYAQLDRDTWSLSCTINSDFPAAADRGIKADKTTLDLESVKYGINIIDHAAAPMQQSVIVVRQLIQYVLGLANGFQQQGQQQGE